MNQQKKGKDPGLRDYGGPDTVPEPGASLRSIGERGDRQQRGYSGWREPADTPRSFSPPAGQPTIYQPDSKDTRKDIQDGTRRPPYYVQPGADRDRPNVPKDTIEPVHAYGYAPSKRAAPTQQVPAQGPRAQFKLPLSGELGTARNHQTTGDPTSQGKPDTPGNGGNVGPGGHGPIAYLQVPPASAPPTATKQPPFDIVGRKQAQPMDTQSEVQEGGATMDTINTREKPKTGSLHPAYSLSPNLREPIRGIYPLGSGTSLPLEKKGLTQIGYVPKKDDFPKEYHGPSTQQHYPLAERSDANRAPADGPQVKGRNYADFRQRSPVPAVLPGVAPGDKLFRRQRKPDPDETKAGNQ